MTQATKLTTPNLPTLDLTEKPVVQQPNNYSVFLLNDDFTPAYLVVEILVECFKLTEVEARQKMMQAHRSGTSLIGIFSKDMADTRVARARAMAEGYPLNFNVSVE